MQKKYEVLGIVGEGAYGVVYKCRNKLTNEFVAIKKFKEIQDELTQKTMKRELSMLQSLKHENIVEFKEAFTHKGNLFLVFEYIEKNLLELLEETPDGINPKIIKKLIYQLIKATIYLHQNNIIHRDIKPENLLIDNNLTLKLCDFGFARKVILNNENNNIDQMTDYVATRWYRSPELLLSNGIYGPEVDYWSIGCIMGELIDGNPLFPGENELDQIDCIIKILGNLPECLIEMFYKNPIYYGKELLVVRKWETLEGRYFGKVGKRDIKFMEKLLMLDPRKRISGEDALNDEYFDDLYDDDLNNNSDFYNEQDDREFEEKIKEEYYEKIGNVDKKGYDDGNNINRNNNNDNIKKKNDDNIKKENNDNINKENNDNINKENNDNKNKKNNDNINKENNDNINKENNDNIKKENNDNIQKDNNDNIKKDNNENFIEAVENDINKEVKNKKYINNELKKEVNDNIMKNLNDNVEKDINNELVEKKDIKKDSEINNIGDENKNKYKNNEDNFVGNKKGKEGKLFDKNNNIKILKENKPIEKIVNNTMNINIINYNSYHNDIKEKKKEMPYNTKKKNNEDIMNCLFPNSERETNFKSFNPPEIKNNNFSIQITFKNQKNNSPENLHFKSQTQNEISKNFPKIKFGKNKLSKIGENNITDFNSKKPYYNENSQLGNINPNFVSLLPNGQLATYKTHNNEDNDKYNFGIKTNFKKDNKEKITNYKSLQNNPIIEENENEDNNLKNENKKNKNVEKYENQIQKLSMLYFGKIEYKKPNTHNLNHNPNKKYSYGTYYSSNIQKNNFSKKNSNNIQLPQLYKLYGNSSLYGTKKENHFPMNQKLKFYY